MCFLGGESLKITQEIPQNAKILLLQGGGSIKNVVYDEIMGVLKGFDVAEFSAIEANPDFETCLKARDYANRQAQISCSQLVAEVCLMRHNLSRKFTMKKITSGIC